MSKINLVNGLQMLAKPLKDGLFSLLEDQTFMKELEKQFVKLQNNRELCQETAFDLLHTLGSYEDMDNQEREAGHDEAHEGDGRGIVVTLSGGGSANLDNASPNPPCLPADGAEQGTAVVAHDQMQPQGVSENFFDWEQLQPFKVPETVDIMEQRYQSLLALWKQVKISLGVLGTSLGVEGIPGLIQHTLHKNDFLAFYRSTTREILLPFDAGTELSGQRLKKFDTSLFDSAKFNGSDCRLTSVTYNNGKYGTITAFQITTETCGRPINIRPEAAMTEVPKIILRKFYKEAHGSITEILKAQGNIWEVTEQKWKEKIGKSTVRLTSSPDVQQHEGAQGDPTVGEALKLTISIGESSLKSFNATIPQMIAMLHQKTEMIEEIVSNPVDVDQPRNHIVIVRGPTLTGHSVSNPCIVVFAPAKGVWVQQKLSWK